MRAVPLVAALVMSGPGTSRAADPNRFPTFASLGQYSNPLASICGRRGVDASGVAIPGIGCFAVKAGSSVTGSVEGRSVSIDVDAGGDETFLVDGREPYRGLRGSTDDALVRSSSSGSAFCRADDGNDCPTTIDALAKRLEEFTVFSVAREVRPHVYVTNEENFRYEESRHQGP